MPRRKRPTVELFRPESWRSEVETAITSITPSNVIEYLKQVPGENMFADTMHYMERAYGHFGYIFGFEAKEKLIETVIKKFTYFRSYHGCRPFSIESYFRDGLRVLSRDRLARYAFELFEGTISYEDLILRAQKADLQTRLGNVYFTAEAEELVSECGHYLIYGGEALSCLWHDGNGGINHLFADCQARHREKGIPTVFECDVPIEWLPNAFRKELANTLVTYHLKLESEKPVPVNDWSRNWGHYISRDLPPRLIRSHFHPANIPDPLRLCITYKNSQTRCPMCK
jgi:hypothetical protein